MGESRVPLIRWSGMKSSNCNLPCPVVELICCVLYVMLTFDLRLCVQPQLRSQS